MALKADRDIIQTDISFFMSTTAERGGIVSHVTGGSGIAMDQSNAVVAYVADPSGVKPVGVLLCDVTNLDLTRQHRNWYKEEVQVGGKVTVAPKCVVVTNMIYSGQTPAVGEVAYVAHSGLIARQVIGLDHVDPTGLTRRVGRFISIKDEDGYAKVSVNLPNF